MLRLCVCVKVGVPAPQHGAGIRMAPNVQQEMSAQVRLAHVKDQLQVAKNKRQYEDMGRDVGQCDGGL